VGSVGDPDRSLSLEEGRHPQVCQSPVQTWVAFARLGAHHVVDEGLDGVHDDLQLGRSTFVRQDGPQGLDPEVEVVSLEAAKRRTVRIGKLVGLVSEDPHQVLVLHRDSDVGSEQGLQCVP
jgi:hypothetical protein